MADKSFNTSVEGYTNHYSPKYNRCFLETASKTLADAYERTILATFGKTCQIDGIPSDCEKTAAFISDHMKN